MTDTTAPEAAYTQVCESYHAIDAFRMKLLGLLPVATGTGVFLLLNSNGKPLGAAGTPDRLKDFLRAIGLFGCVFTLGLFAFELFGIKRCHALIQTGTRLEVRLGVDGQFRRRPHKLMRIINEPFASALIYPASMAAWLFLAVAFEAGTWHWALPLGAFAAGLTFTLLVADGIKRSGDRSFRDELAAIVAPPDEHGG
jgi:hypothetical protein